MSRSNLLILWDRMGDYHRARVRAIEEIFDEGTVFTADLAGKDDLYKWKNSSEANHFVLSNDSINSLNHLKAYQKFKQVVYEKRITHVCIPGYGRKAYIYMLIWCRLHNIKSILFAESWYATNIVFDRLKGFLINKTVSKCFVSGKRASSHFSSRLKINGSQIVEGYSVINNSHFEVLKPIKSSPPILLCVARFSPEKSLDVLIKAYKKSKLNNTWLLQIVGGGPLKNELKALIKAKDSIELIDWLPYDLLPELYANASCYILPSSFEPWGLVVNEAMAASLPIILNDQIGALPDLLDESKNGWSFNLNSLVEILNKLYRTPRSQLVEMGKYSNQIIQNYSCHTWAKKLKECLT